MSESVWFVLFLFFSSLFAFFFTLAHCSGASGTSQKQGKYSGGGDLFGKHLDYPIY